MDKDPVVIVEAKRTPIGAFQGSLKEFKAPDLGGMAIQSVLNGINIDPALIDEVIMGCVLTAGVGQAPARQAAVKAGLPDCVSATTVNKVCGSGMRAVMMAYDALRAGSATMVLAGGMESMTNAPYLLEKARSGLRMGHGKITDHMFFDGLEDAYQQGMLMGHFAEQTAMTYGFTRESQDAFALNSIQKAQFATENGQFTREIVSVAVGKEGKAFAVDEPVVNAKPEKIPHLKPAFHPKGTITAANASGISDGAAVLLLTHQSTAEKYGLTVRARIVATAQYAHAPQLFTTAPIGAIKRLFTHCEWTRDSVDLWEINEAFAMVTMAAIKDLDLDASKVNVNGGACALGHPIGATGARMIVTLLHALETRNLKRGVASPCIGGGEATAIAIERY